jgi:hypothetical protein
VSQIQLERMNAGELRPVMRASPPQTDGGDRRDPVVNTADDQDDEAAN